jgi:UDP-N-acetylglucosamine 4,6-dehydratase
MSLFKNCSVLITGGTGTLGKALIEKLLKNDCIGRVAVYSRDEWKQQVLRQEFDKESRIRWFLGDIRDLDRLTLAMYGVDFVVHAAALKQVDTGEYNPMEFIKTNVLGSQNVIDASIRTGVKKVIALSTDKASSPINLYGATKLTADKLFIAANNYGQPRGTAFSVVRYGNVMGSRGSVIPFWRSLVSQQRPLPITDTRMTRFWITIEEAVQFVLDSFDLMSGGELYVPKIPSMKIVDLARAVSGEARLESIGMRPGEKLHEEMISADDSRRTLLSENRYIVMPVAAEWGFVQPKGVPMEDGMAYQSHTNELWISTENIAKYLGDIKL